MRKFLTLLVMVVSMTIAMAQNKTVTGKVTDEKGIPVANASVLVKGTTKGTSTSSDGSFSISLAASSKTLSISSVGFTTVEIAIGSKTSINVILSSTASNLEEVYISTGITKQKRSQFAGAVSSISPKNIADRPVGSFDQLLQGQVPGLLAVTTSGQPGNSTNVTIRGTSSIAGGSGPLYILDGIPIEAGVFQGLNPNDFANIEVLKDAASAALYGSRGSAGVVVITSKRGTYEKMRLTYDAQFGQKAKPEFSFRPMSTAELLKAQEDYGKIAGGGAAIPGWFYSKLNPRYATLTPTQQTQADGALDSISKINTNWGDYFFRTGTFSNHQISVSGGTGKTRIYSSIGLYNEEGTTARTDMKRISWRTNVDYVDDKLSFSVSSTLAYTKRNFQQSTVTNNLGNPFLATSITTPYSLVYKADGSFATGIGAGFSAANQLDLTSLDRNYSDQLKGTIGVTTAYKIIPQLTAAITAGVDFRETQFTNYGSKLAFNRTVSTSLTGQAGFVTEQLTRFLSPNFRPSITYANTFKKHAVSVGVIGEYIAQFNKFISLQGFGIDPRTPGTPAAITQGDANNQLYASVTGSKTQNALYSGLAVATYTFDDKYSFTGTYRYDGSSKLPTANKWVGFYSLSGVWSVSKENFLRDSKVISDLRLRASYGGSGNNDNFPTSYGDFGYLPTYAANGNYSGLTTLYATGVGNPALTWEKVYQTNIGLDFSLFKDRISGSVDVYDKRTKDLFVQKQLTAEAGGYSILVNGGELQNKGIETNLTFMIVKSKNFRWSINGNFAYNKNNVLSLGGLGSYTVGTSLVALGKPLGSHFEVKWGGVDAASGAPLYYTKDGKLTTTYNTADKVQEFGTYEAPWKGGFGTSLRYKDFDLSVLFSWQQGGNKTDNLEFFVENPVGFLANGYNQSSSLNFWKKPGDIASTQSPLFGSQFSSKIIHDASFLRLRDVTLSYTMPQSVAQKIKFISKIRFYVQGSNLFIWTKWRGFDPEAGPVNINLSEYPNPRAITTGLNITF
ncbi:MAG: SusC/RagA family TonB-linked outer membrane protein [Deinococcales bacterium]|nr:SusC/RagA family TonB-linked outer membrane protein [Chitinophagaceae bacterium]